jgi:eight-cysteine-cluster-containing protein
MNKKKIILACSLVFAIAWGGCGQNNDNNSISKEDAANLAKADDTTDYCEIYGWYGDGICDTFCLNPDPDCDSEQECYVGGCSSQICSDTPDVISTCEWYDYYQCYQLATCGTLPSGKCGWSGDELVQCLYSYDACPMYSLPPPWWCDGGVLVEQDPMDNGCPRPPACERKEGATCGGEHDFQCDEGFYCVEGICTEDEPEPPEPGCYVGGCSSQICSDTPDVISTCEWLDYYQCYDIATCGTLPSGKCGWSGGDEFVQCLYTYGACPLYSLPPEWYCDGGTFVEQDPMENGCPMPPACERKEGATCGGEHDFQCDQGFVCVDDVCLPDDAPCYVGGCSGQICSDTPDVISTCEWLDYYQCYDLASAICGRLPSGNCGWSGGSEFTQCLYANDACPYFSPPPPWYCDGGTLVDRDPLDNGCPLPPACERKEGTTCGGEHDFQCDEGFVCEMGICEAA